MVHIHDFLGEKRSVNMTSEISVETKAYRSIGESQDRREEMGGM
jgi:hypothetical protein